MTGGITSRNPGLPKSHCLQWRESQKTILLQILGNVDRLKQLYQFSYRESSKAYLWANDGKRKMQEPYMWPGDNSITL